MKSLILGITIVSLLLLGTVGKAKQDEALVLYLSFDEGADDTAKDLSGNGNNGTIHGATWVNGKINSALSFERGDFVEVPHSESLSITKEITVMAWSNCTDISENPTVVGKGSGGTPDLFELSLQGGGIYWQFKVGGAWVECVGPLPPIGEWHHIAGTFDGKSLKVYIDGEFGAELQSSQELPENEFPVSIGQRINPEERFFKGMIDEVAIFNRALSAEEIQKAMGGIETAVKPEDKLTATWGEVKAQY